MALNVPPASEILPLISELNHVYTDQMTLHYVTANQPCPDCVYDPVTQQSTDVTCQTCGGRGMITVDNPITIPVSIDYPDEFNYDYTAAGQAMTGAITVVIDIVEINQYNIDPEKVTYFEWMGSQYELEKMEKGVFNGVLYEYDLVLYKKGTHGGE